MRLQANSGSKYNQDSRSGHRVLLYGYNTDIQGFQESIKPLLQKYHHKAMVLGSGGASKAVVKASKPQN